MIMWEIWYGKDLSLYVIEEIPGEIKVGSPQLPRPHIDTITIILIVVFAIIIIISIIAVTLSSVKTLFFSVLLSLSCIILVTPLIKWSCFPSHAIIVCATIITNVITQGSYLQESNLITSNVSKWKKKQNTKSALIPHKDLRFCNKMSILICNASLCFSLHRFLYLKKLLLTKAITRDHVSLPYFN